MKCARSAHKNEITLSNGMPAQRITHFTFLIDRQMCIMAHRYDFDVIARERATVCV